MLGQRWEYRVGNSVVKVDNAFNWGGLARERLIVNDETIREASGWFGIFRRFDESWLTSLGEGELRAVLQSRLMGIACTVTLDGKRLDPDALWEANWNGVSSKWPPEHEWVQARGNKWMA